MFPRARHLPAWLALLSALAVGCASTVKPPDAMEVTPREGLVGVATPITVRGASFRPVVRLDFDRPGSSPVNAAFEVFIGDVAATDVTWLGPDAITATVPGSLAEGAYDVKVVDPRGASDVLPGGFTVTHPPGHLSIESERDGTGTPVGDETFALGTTLVLFAVARDDDGGFLAELPDSTWALDGGIGDVAVDATGAAMLHATAAGTGIVTARHPLYGAASTGVLTVVACVADGDCVDACHSTGQCRLGSCVQGPADRDADQDTFIDAMCVGGTDCDDSLASVNPNGMERGYATAVCSDGLDNDCDGKRDAADPDCAPNSAPIARIGVTPPGGTPADTFTGSGAASTDRESSQGELAFAWDWDDDGVFEASGLTTTHDFSAPGLHRVTLKVTDPQGLAGVSSTFVMVSGAASTATVTTGVDESDPGATPAAPGGVGFSLREALAWSAATAGRELVIVPAGTVVALTRQLDLTGSTGAVLVGDGAVVDGAGISGGGASCLDVAGDDFTILGLEIRNCPGWPIYAHGDAAQVSRCLIHDNTYGVEWGGNDGVFGPFNRVWANGSHGVEVTGRARVIDNVVTANAGPGVILRSGASDSRLLGNVIFENAAGIKALSQCQRLSMRFNTVHGNTGAGVELANNTSGHELLNTILSDNVGWGIDVMTASFSRLDANDLHGNTLGACRNCAGLGPKTLREDPMYLDAAAGDLRIDLRSPLVDSGLDTGDDRTPSTPGDFLGAAPDIGASEVR